MPFSDGVADFRSDTVTRPTPEMLEAMTVAPLGDDVYHDDPTVLLLEEESAAAVGKKAAILVPTGTMGNQLSIMFHTTPGEEILAHEGSHVRGVEAGAPQALSGVGFRTVTGPGGQIKPEEVEQIMGLVGFFPRISLMVWENTHNMSGGRVIPFDLFAETSAVARRFGLSIHLDGARLFNAVAATGVPAARWSENVDTVQFCYSKGLGAPIGSVVCGDDDVIDEIRYLRRRMGGGMRQAGVIAAAARIALADRDRLGDDHVLARMLGEKIEDRFPGSVDVESIETNMVRPDLDVIGIAWQELETRFADAGIRVNPPMGGGWRLVTHRDVDEHDVGRLVSVLS